MVGSGLSQAWISVYFADVYTAAYGYETNARGRGRWMFATVALIVHRAGHRPAARRQVVGCALSARRLANGRRNRLAGALPSCCSRLLSMRVTALWLLAVVAVLVGIVGELLHADHRVRVGHLRLERTASVTGFMNMVADSSSARRHWRGAAILGVHGAGGTAMRWPSIRVSGCLAWPRVTVTAGIGTGIYVALRMYAGRVPRHA